MKYITFERFEIGITEAQARYASHPGPCDADVAELVREPTIAAQLDTIDADLIRAELREYGAWDVEELADDAANRERIVWIAAGNYAERRDVRAVEGGAQ